MFHARLSHATIVAYLALFIALGGTAYAATSLPANSVGTKQLASASVTTAKLHNQAVTAAKVANNSLTGKQINVSTLGTVPNAAQLEGAPASSYLAHCPTGLTRVPNGSLCFDANERQKAHWTDAIKNCALSGLHLPSPGELIQVFNELDARQDPEWTSSAFADFAGPTTDYLATTMDQGSDRTIGFGAGSTSIAQIPYRCVTYASN